MNLFKFILTSLIVFFLQGCDSKVSLEAKKIHWDRDMCERCKMVLSDRNFSAQVINPDNGRKYVFDDIGCVVLWFKQDHIAWADRAIIWVNHVKTGEWIDARKAWYDVENVTPMAYGFGAHLSKESITLNQEMIDFDEVIRRVLKIGK